MTVDLELDRIERETTINATLERVWSLVSTPGWWINDGAIIDHDRENAGTDRVIVHDPDHGDFAVATVQMDAPLYAAYRWYSGPSEGRRTGALAADSSTLVEFFLEPSDGQVCVRVVETGFATIDEAAGERRQMFDSNSEGWEFELRLAKQHVESAIP